MIAATKRTIDKYGLKDRVTLLEGPAQESIKTCTGTFDIIFVDADKEGYEGYVRTVLDRKLLARDGVIICDNGNLQSSNSVTIEPVWVLIFLPQSSLADWPSRKMPGRT